MPCAALVPFDAHKMFVECIHRHLAVCSLADLPSFTKRDPKFWNVISLLGPRTQRPTSTYFKDHCRAHFDDVCALPSSHTGSEVVVSAPTMRGILEFIDGRPGQPVLIHCVAGISRSPALALVILLRGFLAAGDSSGVHAAVETLLAIRPQARPNPLVLQIGLACFLSEAEAASVTDESLSILRQYGSLTATEEID